MINCPRPIQTDASNPFANRTLRERLPAILRETRALNPDYSPRIHDVFSACMTSWWVTRKFA